MENHKTIIVKEYLEEYKELPSLTLAKLIYKSNNQLFKDVEEARSIIRNYRGLHGIATRNSIKDRRFYRDIQAPYNPFSIPESDEREFENYILPENLNRLLIFGDVHIPYHNVDSLSLMLEYAFNQKIDSVLLNGDIIDFYHLSVFMKDPKCRHFPEEIEMVKHFLDVVTKNFKSKVYFKYGNHEERYENYLRLKAPELIGIKEYELSNILGFVERNIDFIKDKRTIKFGKLNILHGHELKGGIIPPVNAARGVFLRAKENTIVNHFHTDSKHSEPTLSDTHISCWSIGCMCELHPEYAVNNRWVHGFAIVDKISEEGDFTVNTKQVINRKIM